MNVNFAGYKFDELDRNSVNLRFQFARRYPGARSGGAYRGKRWIMQSQVINSIISIRPHCLSTVVGCWIKT